MTMSDNTAPNLQYFNDAQYYALAMNTRDEVIVAGRGQRCHPGTSPAVVLSGHAGLHGWLRLAIREALPY